MSVSMDVERLVDALATASGSPMLAPPFSVSARFQALLAQARAASGQQGVAGYYEVMVMRVQRAVATGAGRAGAGALAVADGIVGSVYQATFAGATERVKGGN